MFFFFLFSPLPPTMEANVTKKLDTPRQHCLPDATSSLHRPLLRALFGGGGWDRDYEKAWKGSGVSLIVRQGLGVNSRRRVRVQSVTSAGGMQEHSQWRLVSFLRLKRTLPCRIRTRLSSSWRCQTQMPSLSVRYASGGEGGGGHCSCRKHGEGLEDIRSVTS